MVKFTKSLLTLTSTIALTKSQIINSHQKESLQFTKNAHVNNNRASVSAFSNYNDFDNFMNSANTYSIEEDDNDMKINLLSSEILKKIEEQVKIENERTRLGAHDREHRSSQTNIDNSYSSKNFGYICTAESNIPYSIKDGLNQIGRDGVTMDFTSTRALLQI